MDPGGGPDSPLEQKVPKYLGDGRDPHPNQEIYFPQEVPKYFEF